MQSSVLRSERVVLVNVEVAQAFVRMRQLLAANADLARKLDALEKKYDAQFRAVFDAIARRGTETLRIGDAITPLSLASIRSGGG